MTLADTPPRVSCRRAALARLAAVASALALPACAHAQGEGLAKILLSAIAIGYALFVLVVVLVVRPPRTKAFVGLALVFGPFALAGLAWLLSSLGARYQDSIQARETAQATRYLEQVCATQRVVPTGIVTLHGADGLYVSPTPPLRLAESQAEQAPSLLALLGASLFSMPLAVTRHEHKYITPLVWTARLFRPDLPPDHDFLFIEQEEAGHLRAIATHDWWQAHGLARVRDDQRAEQLRVLASNQDHLVSSELGDDQPQARYRLELADISTAEDRQHWVARGRMRLVDGRDGTMLAQYVGFSANLQSNRAADYGDTWEKTLECPGPERAYPHEYGAWPAMDFFFARFVRVD